MDGEENKNDTNSPNDLSFEPLKAHESEDFPEPDNDKKILDAEILRETKTTFAAPIIEKMIADDPISNLLSNLDTSKEVSIMVKRLPDNQYAGQFRLPCDGEQNIETLRWDGEPIPQRHYDYIRTKYGGGVYRLQLHYDGGYKKAWRETLRDPIEPSKAEIAENERKAKTYEPPRTVESSQAFANQPNAQNNGSLDDLLNQVRKLKELQEIFTPAAAPAAPAAPAAVEEKRVTKEDIKLLIIEKALTNPTLQTMALEAAFDIQRKDNTRPPGFWESIAQSIGANEKIADMLINGVSNIAAPLAQLAMMKLMPMPQPPPGAVGAASPPNMPTLQRPAINNQPPPAPPVQQQPPPQPETTAPQTTAETPMQTTANLPALPLITLK